MTANRVDIIDGSFQLFGTPTWSPPTEIAARYLASYLHELGRAAGGAR